MDNSNQDIFEFSLKNNLSEINHLSERVKEFALRYGLSNADYHDVNLVLEEWFSNLVHHGYRGNKKSEIKVNITIRDNELYIKIIDEGKYFNPGTFTLPNLKQPLDKRVPGGIGLHLIFQLMDKVSYKRVNNKNVLQLKKYCTNTL